MATHDYIIANGTGAAVRADLNNALAAIVSNNSNSSEPATKYAYQWWADLSNNVMKIRNSANDGWIELFQLDGTITLEDGSASTPALANRSDLNTGVFFSAADKFNIATGGVERMELGTTTIFNEDGADVDFRIEGDTEANLFYVDAGNDRIGIGTSSPDTILDVVHTDVSVTAGSNDIAVFRKTGEGYLKVLSNNAGVGGLAFGDTDDNFIGSIRYDHTDDALEFFINNSERARIDSSGKLLVGVTSPHSLDAVITALRSSACRIGVGNTDTSATGECGVDFLPSNTTVGARIECKAIEDFATTANRTADLIFETRKDGVLAEKARLDNSGNFGIGLDNASEKLHVSGNILATGTITPNSDIAFKKDIKPLTNVLNKVTQLIGINFRYKNNNEESMGLVAQDVEKVFPELVKGEEGNKSLNYMGLTGALIEAIKELSAKVEALEAA